MSSTTFQGPVISGPVFNSDGINNKNTGFALLSQTVTIQSAATTNVATAFVPQFSQIVGLAVNNVTAWGVTTATLAVGTPTNATAYVNATAIGTAFVSVVPAVGALSFNTGTTQPVVFTVNNGAVNTTGFSAITLLYIQTERTS